MYVMHGGKAVITLKGVSSGFDWPQAEAYIAEMDPSNPYPEVVFSTFSGGAHCCFNVLIATSTPDGKSWKAMNVGDYDGGFNLKDLDVVLSFTVLVILKRTQKITPSCAMAA